MSCFREFERGRLGRGRYAFAALVFCAYLLCAVQSAAAQRPDGDKILIPLAGIVELPAYCDYVQAGKTAFDPTRGVPLMGPTFHHIHHYCWALGYMRRAQDPTISAKARRDFYVGATKDMQYVIERATPDFVLLPEVFLRMGQALFGSGDVAGALDYFDRSRRTKADYWPAYIEIARTNLSFGRRQEAEAALKAGLSVSPDEPNLKQALVQLGARSAGAKKPSRSN